MKDDEMASDEAANFVLERGRAVYAELQQARAEVNRLRAALGHCNASADGRHLWAIFPVDTQGRLSAAPMPSGVYGAGCFCQHCFIPKSPYHDSVDQQRTSND